MCLCVVASSCAFALRLASTPAPPPAHVPTPSPPPPVKDDGAVMALFFGVLGVLCAAVLLPVVCVLWTLGSPVVTDVTARALGLALVQGASMGVAGGRGHMAWDAWPAALVQGARTGVRRLIKSVDPMPNHLLLIVLLQGQGGPDCNGGRAVLGANWNGVVSRVVPGQLD